MRPEGQVEVSLVIGEKGCFRQRVQLGQRPGGSTDVALREAGMAGGRGRGGYGEGFEMKPRRVNPSTFASWPCNCVLFPKLVFLPVKQE